MNCKEGLLLRVPDLIPYEEKLNLISHIQYTAADFIPSEDTLKYPFNKLFQRGWRIWSLNYRIFRFCFVGFLVSDSWACLVSDSRISVSDSQFLVYDSQFPIRGFLCPILCCSFAVGTSIGSYMQRAAAMAVGLVAIRLGQYISGHLARPISTLFATYVHTWLIRTITRWNSSRPILDGWPILTRKIHHHSHSEHVLIIYESQSTISTLPNHSKCFSIFSGAHLPLHQTLHRQEVSLICRQVQRGVTVAVRMAGVRARLIQELEEWLEFERDIQNAKTWGSPSWKMYEHILYVLMLPIKIWFSEIFLGLQEDLHNLAG